MILFFPLSVCTFLVARLFSLFGGKWSPFAKTGWKLDLAVSFGQSLVITALVYWL
ncbi:MAG TPA: hypothetical protein VFK44_13970 [Bacillales bacterium]|nr:hypothetical protein [Bacillales bacterium]